MDDDNRATIRVAERLDDIGHRLRALRRRVLHDRRAGMQGTDFANSPHRNALDGEHVQWKVCSLFPSLVSAEISAQIPVLRTLLEVAQVSDELRRAEGLQTAKELVAGGVCAASKTNQT
jgi:hypothetical protein